LGGRDVGEGEWGGGGKLERGGKGRREREKCESSVAFLLAFLLVGVVVDQLLSRRVFGEKMFKYVTPSLGNPTY